MNEEQKLREVIETNFQLSILHTRQVGDRLGRRIDGIVRGMQELASATREEFEGLADRQAETLEVLRKIGDSSVDIHKEILELKRRVSELENRAS